MAAPPLEMSRALAQPVVQVEGRDRAARAFPVPLGACDQHDRPVVALDQARSDDPDHALVPALAGEHIRAAGPARLWPSLDRLDRLPRDSLLHRLPVTVQLLEVGG